MKLVGTAVSRPQYPQLITITPEGRGNSRIRCSFRPGIPRGTAKPRLTFRHSRRLSRGFFEPIDPGNYRPLTTFPGVLARINSNSAPITAGSRLNKQSLHLSLTAYSISAHPELIAMSFPALC